MLRILTACVLLGGPWLAFADGVPPTKTQGMHASSASAAPGQVAHDQVSPEGSDKAKEMSRNDILTLVVSSLALVVSISSALVSTHMQRREMRTTLRTQLTSVVQDLIAAQAELERLLGSEEAKTDAGISRSASLNHRLTALARQACALDQLDGSVGFDVEFVAVANALNTSGDYDLAESYFKKSIDAAPSPYYRALNTTFHANFLFQRGRIAVARDAYRTALSLLPNRTDGNRVTNVRALEGWICNERSIAARAENVDGLVKEARGLLGALEAEWIRQAETEQFNRYMASLGVAPGPLS